MVCRGDRVSLGDVMCLRSTQPDARLEGKAAAETRREEMPFIRSGKGPNK